MKNDGTILSFRNLLIRQSHDEKVNWCIFATAGHMLGRAETKRHARGVISMHAF